MRRGWRSRGTRAPVETLCSVVRDITADRRTPYGASILSNRLSSYD